VFSPRLASTGPQAGGWGVYLKGGGRGFCPGCPGGGGRGRGGLVHPRILITCPGSQGTSCPCSLFMIRVEFPGSSFMLCLGPGPPSLLHLTRANAEKPYAGDTVVQLGTRKGQAQLYESSSPGSQLGILILMPSNHSLFHIWEPSCPVVTL